MRDIEEAVCMLTLETEPVKVGRTVQCQHLIPALNVWAAQSLYTAVCMYVWMTSQLNIDFISKLCGHQCFGLFFEMLSIHIFTTRNLQTSGGLVQESSVYTVNVTPSIL